MALSNEQKARLLNVGDIKTILDKVNGENTIKTVSVNSTALTPSGKTVDIEITMEKKSAANEGYVASYQLKANGVAVGDDIDIPKDWLLSAVTKGTVTAADKQEGGKFADDASFEVGDRYIDMTFNVKAGKTETATHIYLNVQEFIDVYTAGNGLQESNGEFSIKLDNTTQNGLKVDANGLGIGLAAGATTTYVAATGTYDASVTYYSDQNGTAADVTGYEDGVTDVTNPQLYVAETTLAKNGAMTGADKAKLDSFVMAESGDITQLLADVYGA